MLARAVNLDGAVASIYPKTRCSLGGSRQLHAVILSVSEGALQLARALVRFLAVSAARDDMQSLGRFRKHTSQKPSGVRVSDLHDLLWRSLGNNFPAVSARFGPKIDNPVGAFNHFKVVLDHDQRMAGIDQALKNLKQHRDVIEMQTGGRLVKDEKIAARSVPRRFALRLASFRQMSNKF